MADRITEKLCALLKLPPETKRVHLTLTHDRLAQVTTVTDVLKEGQLNLDEKIERFELVPIDFGLKTRIDEHNKKCAEFADRIGMGGPVMMEELYQFLAKGLK